MLTLSTLYALIALAIFAGLIAFLIIAHAKFKWKFSVRVVAALGLGALFGTAVNLLFKDSLNSGTGATVLEWVNLIGTGFTYLLKFIIVPLIVVSIVNAIGKTTSSKEGAKKAGRIVAFLLITTAVVAVISIAVLSVFPFTQEGLNSLVDQNTTLAPPNSVAETLLNLIPTSFFGALAGDGILPVVFVAALIGFAFVALKKDETTRPSAEKFEKGWTVAYDFVLKIVDYIIELTPYGILAIIATRIAKGNWQMFAQLGMFIGASFAAMILVFGLHILALFFLGCGPKKYFSASGVTLLNAFTTRSSAATLPLTQNSLRRLGVDEATADLASTLGTCVGQHGCAGVYPTMVAILAGIAQGWNSYSLLFLVPLVIYVVIASIGTAGVGGGAFNVSLLVLTLVGLPIELAVIFMAVDFIVDMGRTALNVSDSILAGVVVHKWSARKQTKVKGARTGADKDLGGIENA
ncbi:L-cystine transporter tcyP [Clostridia bacterium]|nr:L-cystine transporter tcyP [Clostridia bacterium]